MKEISTTVDTRYLDILGTSYKNVQISECGHKRRQQYADEFSLCLTLYKCACLTNKSMEDVFSCPIISVCV